MILSIDTANYNQAQIALKDKDQIVAQKAFTAERQLSEKLLPEIKNLLGENDTNLSDLTAVRVNLGPGSFTSLRIGISVANALGFALNIPINDNLPSDPVFPRYGKEPNITYPPRI